MKTKYSPRFFQNSLDLDVSKEDPNLRISKTEKDGKVQWTLNHQGFSLLHIPADLVMACMTRSKQVPHHDGPDLKTPLRPSDLTILVIAHKVAFDFDPNKNLVDDYRLFLCGVVGGVYDTEKPGSGRKWAWLWDRFYFMTESEILVPVVFRNSSKCLYVPYYWKDLYPDETRFTFRKDKSENAD